MTFTLRAAAMAAWAGAAAALALMGGCASTAISENYESAQQFSRQRLGAELKWLTSDEARQQAAADVQARLAQPLDGDDAVRIALAHSPALQALLYEGAASAASAAQGARLPNPVFAVERLLRRGQAGGPGELEVNRVLSFSVLDLLLLPARMRLADHRQQAARLALAAHVVDAAHDARAAWTRAVAAQQALQYATRVKAAADAGAELARRMQAAGNYSRLQRAREQAFAAEAVAQLTRARQADLGAREALVRALGLDDGQAASLRLPERLPDLPAAPLDEAGVARTAIDQRLDVRMARAHLEFLAREQGLSRVTSVVNGLELGLVRNSQTGLAPQRGAEVSLPLPVFDFGDGARAQAEATYMAALNRTAQVAVRARSQVREQYGGYRAAYELARHYRDDVVPVRKAMAEENLLRYNAMLIGVFELLADAREQAASVVQAIEAQRDFWLADARLQAALIGRPADADTAAPLSARPEQQQQQRH